MQHGKTTTDSPMETELRAEVRVNKNANPTVDTVSILNANNDN